MTVMFAPSSVTVLPRTLGSSPKRCCEKPWLRSHFSPTAVTAELVNNIPKAIGWVLPECFHVRYWPMTEDRDRRCHVG